jgi:ABC-type lipoprotein release transport system permease subunit
MFSITIIGWIWLGIIIGTIAGFVICSWLTQSKVSELESEITHHIFVRDSLKEEIFKLDNQAKPKPRKRRNVRAKSIKIGK